MDAPNKVKERKLEWMYAQLRKYQIGKYESSVIHDLNWKPATPDSKIIKDFESRIK